MKEYQEVTSKWPRQCSCGVLVHTNKEDYWHWQHEAPGHWWYDANVPDPVDTQPVHKSVDTVVDTSVITLLSTPSDRRKEYKKEWMRKQRSK